MAKSTNSMQTLNAFEIFKNDPPTTYFPNSLDSEFCFPYEIAVLVPNENIKPDQYSNTVVVRNSLQNKLFYQVVIVTKDTYEKLFKNYTKLLYLGPNCFIECQTKIILAQSINEILALLLTLNKEVDIISKVLKLIKHAEKVDPKQIDSLESQTMSHFCKLDIFVAEKIKKLSENSNGNPKTPKPSKSPNGFHLMSQ